MNNETAILIAIGLALFVLALVFSFSQNLVNEAKNSILGGEDDTGIVDCNPSSGENCPSGYQESSFSENSGEEMVKI